MITCDIRYYYLVGLVPLIALLPDVTMNLINQIFYPDLEDVLIYMQSELGGLLPKVKKSRKAIKEGSVVTEVKLKKSLRSALKRGIN
jgi:hypothetical protein